ncbi:MAG: MlaD family protein [Balneolales bacterium]
MKKLNNEIKIGLTILCAVLIAIIGFRFMQDIPILRQTDMLYTSYDRVNGISVGTTVLMAGVRVGTVREIRLDEGDSVRVELNISYQRGIPKGSIAAIESIDMIGNKAITIRKSDETETYQDGDYIPGIYDTGLMGEVRAVGDKIGPQIIESTDNLASLLTELDRIMQEGGGQDVEQFLRHLNRVTQSIDRTITQKDEELTQAMNSLQNILASVDTLSSDRKEQIDDILNNLERTSSDLNEITMELKGISSELSVTMATINNGEGSLGMFINNPSLYQNVDSLSYNMNLLIKEINENPRVFLKHLKLIELF